MVSPGKARRTVVGYDHSHRLLHRSYHGRWRLERGEPALVLLDVDPPAGQTFPEDRLRLPATGLARSSGVTAVRPVAVRHHARHRPERLFLYRRRATTRLLSKGASTRPSVVVNGDSTARALWRIRAYTSSEIRCTSGVLSISVVTKASTDGAR